MSERTRLDEMREAAEQWTERRTQQYGEGAAQAATKQIAKRECSMMENHLYNLYHQLVQEHKSLWRVKNMYKKDSGDCASCAAFWDKLEKEKEEHVNELQQLIKSHQ